MREIQKLLMELDRLKSVYRRSYLSDRSRNENSAEHSWHLAVALLVLNNAMGPDIDVDHAVRIALAHDICEIGAGDISVYDTGRAGRASAEAAYLSEFASSFSGYALEIERLWKEYEKQETPESRWVKIADRLLPFLMNIATEGKAWKEQGISRSQVLGINNVIEEEAPAVYRWMKEEVDRAVGLGWLEDG